MRIVADLHIHGKYARATSRDSTLQNLEKFARIKGINLLGTGDFTHPKWAGDIKGLKEDGNGILWSRTGFPFIWQTEISLAYTQDGRGRRVHHLIMAPDGEAASQVTEFLKSRGRVDYDGRPIFGMSSIELIEKLISISPKCLLIPAHAWTPYFGVMGSMSGFDSIQDCFKEKAKYVYGFESGLSSDPAMNWRVSSLDNFSILSFSDTRSFWPWRIGRECTVFDADLTYDAVFNAIRSKKIVETIEVSPSYGKYHFTGHRACNVSLSPQESIALNDICPQCRKKVTIGVLQRVEKLADRPEGYRPQDAVPFRTLIPLSEILAAMLKKGIASKETWAAYNKLIESFGSEFSVLLEAGHEALARIVDPKIADALIENRAGRIRIKPGYDGEYGIPLFSNPGSSSFGSRKRQKGLHDYF